MLINVLHNSPISRREYFQYGYRINGYIPVCSLCRHFFLSPPPLYSFISQPSTMPRFSLSNRLKNACRVSVCVCVCAVLSPASYKFNLKNLVLNYALADGIFHREIDFTQSFPVSLLEPPLLSFRRILRSSKTSKFLPKFPSRKATYWHSFFRNDRHRAHTRADPAPPEIPTRRKLPTRPN